MTELARLISQDAGMTGKILGVAHSTAYHRGSQKVGLEQSLISLGIDMIKTLIISESVFQTFNNFSASKNIDLRGFWKHSLTSAIIARHVAKNMAYSNIDEAYLAGLLHDIGRLALLAIAPREYAFHFHAPDDEAICAAEQRMLQITHAEAGALLIEHWHLDSFMADSVLYHHEPVDRIETAHPLIRIVYLAHLLASHDYHDPVIEHAVTLCGVDTSELPHIMENLEERVSQAANFIGIDLSGLEEKPKLDTQPTKTLSTQDRLNAQVHKLVQSSELDRFFSSLNGKNEAEIRGTVCTSARVFFNLGSTFLLLLDAKRNILVAYPPEGAPQRLAGFSIPFGKGDVIAETATKKSVTFLSPDTPPASITSEQIMRILGADSLVCFPLTVDENCIGVLIGGILSWQIKELQQHESFLKSFGTKAAAALKNAGNELNNREKDAAAIEKQYRDASRRIAHEVNNPLTIIKNYLRVLDNKLASREPISSEISILNEELDRVGQIVNGFAEQPSSATGGDLLPPTDLNQVIDDVVRLFRDTEFAPKTVRITSSLQSRESRVTPSPALLKQIMMNLIKNAVEAMPEGGEIMIRNKGTVSRGEKAYIEISLSDTGPGIPKSIMDNLFSPVRSTKGSGHQGLGLSIVHNLVKNIQGQIMCHSDVKGTVFTILIPVPAPGEPISDKKFQTQFSV